ncbi:MAG: serine/threonine protein kinase, partial [Anaerolineae bacterium]|nr:serine/threonine protein kinase [Anaerolineae bacterium]
PSNVLLDESGNVLLSDFGLTRMIESTSDLTRSGALGTPAYMSPEQGQGQPVDARADIYSLGVLLYEMLVGEVPFTADTPIAVIYKHVHEPLPMPRTRRPDLPGAVEKVITKALAKAPEDRFKTAGQMADALRRAVLVAPQETSSDEQDTLPDGPPLRTGSTEAVTLPAAKKRRLPLWGLLLGLALIVALVVGADLVMLYVGKAERTATQAAMLSLVRPTGTVTPLPTVAPTRVAVRGAASATPTGTATATVTASPSPPPTDAPTLTVTRTATTTPRPTVTTIPTLTTAPVACADSPTPRLVVGYQGQTLPGEEPLSNIRYTPAGARIGHLYPEETFDVVGGPQCATLSGYDLAWWQVVAHGSGLAGWVAEGFEGIYWLHPLDAANAGLAVATPAPVCAGAPPARMRLGYQGQTNPKDTTPTYLREQPGAGEDVASIGPGVSFDVIDGPACAAVHGVEYVWWRVRLHSSGVEGWVAEGDAQLYWIEPINRAAHP